MEWDEDENEVSQKPSQNDESNHAEEEGEDDVSEANDEEIEAALS